VRRVTLLTHGDEGAAAVLAQLAPPVRDRINAIVGGDNLEDGMDRALLEGGAAPTAVISNPFTPLPEALFNPAADRQPLDTNGFRNLLEANLTHHFRGATKASLFDDLQLVLVSADVSPGGSVEAFALANFVKTTLHALTGTLAVECERLVNQINLTRRMRSEEPRNAAQTAEELDRFGRAVLLAGGPLANLEGSRYRSRIYRGVAITV
jgi:malonyl-CoA reductase/3-hydroxypropionate dehydrogenase (NADP+)